MYSLIALVSFAAAGPLASLAPLCEVYDGVENPTCTTTFKDTPAAGERLARFKAEVEATCGPIVDGPLQFQPSTVRTTLPSELFEQLILSKENTDFIQEYICIL